MAYYGIVGDTWAWHHLYFHFCFCWRPHLRSKVLEEVQDFYHLFMHESTTNRGCHSVWDFRRFSCCFFCVDTFRHHLNFRKIGGWVKTSSWFSANTGNHFVSRSSRRVYVRSWFAKWLRWGIDLTSNARVASCVVIIWHNFILPWLKPVFVFRRSNNLPAWFTFKQVNSSRRRRSLQVCDFTLCHCNWRCKKSLLLSLYM